jgi:uncharacterized Zn finger protein
MSTSDIEKLKTGIQQHWSHPVGEKAQRYVGKFFDTTRLGTRISGDVEGNHGTYTVTIEVDDKLSAACSCYIGKSGYCHHCHALGVTFLEKPEIFVELKTRSLDAVETPGDLTEYLRGVTLDALLKKLRKIGITQKAFAESMGTSSQHVSAVKSSERRNRYFHDLGALKIACLWFLERFAPDETKK